MLRRYSFAAISFFSLLISCEETPENGKPSVETRPVTEIGTESVTLSGDVTSEGGSDVFERGFVWSLASHPTLDDESTFEGAGIGEFESLVADLESGETYYVRAYASNENGTSYGNEIEFKTNVDLLELQITSTGESVAKGLENQFHATGVFSDGSSSDITNQVDWSSSDEAVGTINNTISKGLFSSLTMGETEISVASGEIVGTYVFTVTQEELTSIVITTHLSIVPGSSSAIVATGYYTDNSEVVISDLVEWNVSVPAVATVDASESGYEINTHDFGSVQIDASLDNITGSINVDVEVNLGDLYQGGYVFYIDETNEHGMVAATEDQSSGIVWWVGSWTYTNTESITPFEGIGYGKSNTEEIVSILGTSGPYAARLCDELNFNGYTDWFLPSIDELELMCINLYSQGIGNLHDEFYWSSTDTNKIHNAWWMQFSNGCQVRTDLGRSFEFRVRAVREF